MELSKNIPFSNTRRTVPVSIESNINPTVESKIYADWSGDRYQVKELGSTASPVIQALDNRYCLSFVSAAEDEHNITLISLNEGEICVVDCEIIGINGAANRGIYSYVHGVWRRDSSTSLSDIKTPNISTSSDWAPGSTPQITITTETNNIVLNIDTRDVVESIEWSIFVTIKENLHSLTTLIPI